MKAVLQEKYGSPESVLWLGEGEKPVPKDDELLIKVYSSSVNYADLAFVTGKPCIIRPVFGFFKPKYKIPGMDVSGQVEAVGKDVTSFQPGDEVYGELSEDGFGAYAEYACAPEKIFGRKALNVSHNESAAAVQASVVALQGLRDCGDIKPGQKVLVCGASGGIGTFAVQIAKSFGAEVTGLCGTGNLDMVKSIGADHVIDYTKEDFVQRGENYDFIIACKGNRSIWDYKKALKPGGTCVVTGGSQKQIFQALLIGPFISMFGNKKLKSLYAKISQDDLELMRDLMESGKVKPVISGEYSVDQIVEAFQHYQSGHSRGKVVISIRQ